MSRYDQMPREELETQDNIKVKEVSRAEFARVQNERSGTDLVDIDQDTWTEVDSQTDILNTGGSPCVIIFIFDKKRGTVLSAHLSTVNEKRNKKFTLMEIAALKRIFTGKDNADAIEVAPPQAIDRLSAKAVDPYFEVYDEMISFLKERNLEDKNSSLEVYLFGHHMQVFGTSYAEASQRITDNVLEQSMLTDTLKSIGINATDIHDFRTPAEPNIDDIFYDSQKRIFYRHRRNKFVLKDHIYEY